MPSYGSINEINLKNKLDGGVGEASFQPIGFSRPNSYCKGTSFTPPMNNQKSLDYIDNKKHYQDKKNIGKLTLYAAPWLHTNLVRK